MVQARRFFFHCTDDAVQRMSELYDFVWPSVTAFVFSRSKAHRHRNLPRPGRDTALKTAFQSDRVLRAEYRNIPGIKRASLSKALIETPWVQIEQVFARLVITNVFAIYEGWLDDLLDQMQASGNINAAWRKKFVLACQFPFRNSKHEDWAWAITELTARKSNDLIACVGQRLRAQRYYSSSQAIPLLYCFRYFKELRNAVVHKNGKVSPQLINAYNQYQNYLGGISITGAAPLGTTSPLSLGMPIELSLYGVVGFNDVVLRLMATLDSEVGLTTFAESNLANFFNGRVNTPSKSGKKDSTVGRMANEFGLVNIKDRARFARMLVAQGVTIPTP